jgi:hypothetical protein
MPKNSRRSKRKVSPGSIEKTVKEPSAYTVSSLPPTGKPAASKSSVNKVAVYDANKHIATELKYSALVAGIVTVLLVIAYILFR